MTPEGPACGHAPARLDMYGVRINHGTPCRGRTEVSVVKEIPSLHGRRAKVLVRCPECGHERKDLVKI